MSHQIEGPIWYTAKLGDGRVVHGMWAPDKNALMAQDISGVSVYNTELELKVFIVKNHRAASTSPIDLLAIEPIEENQWYMSNYMVFTFKPNGSYRYGWPVYVNDLMIQISQNEVTQGIDRCVQLAERIHQFLKK